MARGSSDLLLKKNSKLESFLKRSVTDETFERIRAYESCIVVSEKENKAFKYVILGDECIYLTENPPKSIQEAVHLRDVVSVELVNDFPDFLSGNERENTQHLAVTYITSEPKKRSRRRSKKSGRSGSLSELSIDARSNASTPLGYASSLESFSEDYGYTTQSTSSLQVSRPNSQSSAVSHRDTKNSTSISKKKKKQLNDSLDHDSILRSLKEEMEEDLLENIQEDRLSQKKSSPPSVPGIQVKRNNSPINASQTSVRPLPCPKSGALESTSKATDIKNSEIVERDSGSRCGCSARFCTKIGKNQIVPIACGHGSSAVPSKSSPLDFSGQDKHCLVPDIEVAETDSVVIRSSSPSLQNVPGSRVSLDTAARGSRSGTPSLEAERNRSVSGMASLSDLGESISGLHLLSVDGLPEKRRVVLNIYLLNLTSPLLMLVRSAWSNYLIRSTLMLDPESEKAAKSSAIRGPQNQREKTDVLFNQLKRDLFNEANTLEESYKLLNELQMGTEKNFALKKLFWRSSDVFLFLVRHLQKYLPKSPGNINTDEGRTQRTDELELVILVTEILSLMFRESEIIPARIQTLKAERGKAVLDLLMTLTCTPELPEKLGSPQKSAVFSKKSDDQKGVSDEELSQQLEEFTRGAITAVFELFLMARQANWNHTEGNFFNISWMARVLEEIRTTEKFVERVISQMMELIAPSKFDTLIPNEAVALYQQFSVLLTFLEYSPRITEFIRSNYHEEFKYFIQVPAVAKKLPSQYPLSHSTMQIMERVIAKVLSSTNIAGSRSPR